MSPDMPRGPLPPSSSQAAPSAPDIRVYVRLGHAVARAQLLELAMVKLLAEQKHNPRLSEDERWNKVFGWMRMSAGQLRKALGIPEAVATDLRHVVDRRDRVVHKAWVLYARGEDREASADAWATYLDEEAAVFGFAFNGMMAMVHLVRADSTASQEALDAAWRRHVPEPVEPVAPRVP